MENNNSKLRFDIKYSVILIILVLTGVVTIWLTYTPQGLLGKADAIGYAVCHRIPERSFYINGRPMPMCARCTGMYLGAMIGLIYQMFKYPKRGRLPSKKIVFFLGILAILWSVDGVNSYIHLFNKNIGIYEPNNLLRLLTGSGIGIVASILIYPAFNQTFWLNWKSNPTIDTIQELFLLLGLTLIIDGFVLLENPWILFFASMLSSIGTLLLLTKVYGMIWLIVFKYENRYLTLREAWIPLIAGFIIAIFQIGIMDFVRYWLTGTWSGLIFK